MHHSDFETAKKATGCTDEEAPLIYYTMKQFVFHADLSAKTPDQIRKGYIAAARLLADPKERKMIVEFREYALRLFAEGKSQEAARSGASKPMQATNI